MAFSQLGLNDRLVQGILATGYTAPTAIQARAIPLALQGRDIIGCAQTGTGKTAAFVLPILNHLAEHSEPTRDKRPRALVLTPTRELAQQIEDCVTDYGRFMKLRSVSIYGGVSIDKQFKHLRIGVDIVIATPGRLLDHLDRKTIDLSNVAILVLDEADRMFDMGFINDVKKIMARVSKERQTLLFSATISPEIKKLASTIQKNPETIQIGEERKPIESVTQHFYSTPQDLKADMLIFALEHETMDSVLVFSRTKHGADKITKRLDRANVKAVAIHSNRTQAQRQRALAGFKQGQYRVLVATDIAARGIDVDGISHVINYDVPTFAEDYIHRIGRTGRASATGDAITFVSREEIKHIKKIEYFIGKKVEIKKYPTFNYTPAAHKVESAHVEKAGDDEAATMQRSRTAPRHTDRGDERRQPRDNRSAGERRERKPVSGEPRADRPTQERREWKPRTDTPRAPREERPGTKRFDRTTPGAERRTPRVDGSIESRRERPTSGAAGRFGGQKRTTSGPAKFGQQSGGKFRSTTGRSDYATPVKKREKPTTAKTEAYSTGAYNDSFGSFRSSGNNAVVQDHDWKKLIETNEGTFRKKLKKIFTRSSD